MKKGTFFCRKSFTSGTQQILPPPSKHQKRLDRDEQWLPAQNNALQTNLLFMSRSFLEQIHDCRLHKDPELVWKQYTPFILHWILHFASLLLSEKQKQKMLLTHQFFFTIKLWLTSVKVTEDYGDNDLLIWQQTSSHIAGNKRLVGWAYACSWTILFIPPMVLG